MNLFKRENLMLAKMIKEAGGEFHFLVADEKQRFYGSRLREGEFEFQSTGGVWTRNDNIIPKIIELLRNNENKYPAILKFGEILLSEYMEIRDTSKITLTATYPDEVEVIVLGSDRIPDLGEGWRVLGKYYLMD